MTGDLFKYFHNVIIAIFVPAKIDLHLEEVSNS